VTELKAANLKSVPDLPIGLVIQIPSDFELAKGVPKATCFDFHFPHNLQI
jgi:hypothetical protein